MLLTLLLLLAEPPSAGVLRQEESLQGRSTLTYLPIPVSVDRPETIQPQTWFPKGLLFGSWKVGSAPRQALPVAWLGGTKTLWIDLDQDGRFSEKEKWTLGAKPVEIPLTIDQRSRVLLLRVREETPLIAVRGFVEGEVAIENHRHRVCLFDGGADGCFNKAGIDRVGIDCNRDGKIDPLFEIFTAGSGIDIGGVRYLLKPNATGESIEVFRRPVETGELVFTLNRNEKSEPRDLVLNLVSEWGEWVQVKQVGSFVRMPAGKYRIVDLGFHLVDESKKRWAYHFYANHSKFDLEVKSGEKNTVELLPQLKLHFQLNPFLQDQKNSAPGSVVQGAMVRPWVAASNGLVMSLCDRGSPLYYGAQEDKNSYQWRGEKATVRLNDSGSLKLDEQDTGFL